MCACGHVRMNSPQLLPMNLRSLIATRVVSIMRVPTHDPTLAGLGWRTVGDSKFDSLFDELFVSRLDSQI